MIPVMQWRLTGSETEPPMSLLAPLPDKGIVDETLRSRPSSRPSIHIVLAGRLADSGHSKSRQTKICSQQRS